MPDRIETSADNYHLLDDGKRMRYEIFEPEGVPWGTLLIAPGRREFIEKKRLELAPEFLKQGFRVIIFDWRGHGLSDRPLSGAKRQRDHATDFAIYLRDLESFYTKVVTPNLTGKLLLCGHSMGAHLMLRWLVEYKAKNIAGAIFTAPMLALSNHFAHNVARGLCWLEVKLGNSEDYAPAQHDYNERDRAFIDNPLTQDPDRFSIIETYFNAQPDMTVGGVTWGWLHASLDSMHTIQQRGYLSRLSLPTLFMTGSKDHVTPASELAVYIRQIAGTENYTIAGARHDVMNEVEACRLEAWQRIHTFIKRVRDPQGPS